PRRVRFSRLLPLLLPLAGTSSRLTARWAGRSHLPYRSTVIEHPRRHLAPPVFQRLLGSPDLQPLEHVRQVVPHVHGPGVPTLGCAVLLGSCRRASGRAASPDDESRGHSTEARASPQAASLSHRASGTWGSRRGTLTDRLHGRAFMPAMPPCPCPPPHLTRSLRRPVAQNLAVGHRRGRHRGGRLGGRRRR